MLEDAEGCTHWHHWSLLDDDAVTLVFMVLDYSEIRTKEVFQDRPDRLQLLSLVSVDLSTEMAVALDDRVKVRGNWITSSNTLKAGREGPIGAPEKPNGRSLSCALLGFNV